MPLQYEDFVPVSRMEELADTGLTERSEPMLLGLCLCLGCEACCQMAYILANRHSIRHFSGRI